MVKRKSDRPIDKSTVVAYRHFDELKDCLLSGWPATTTRQYLIDRYGPEGIPHVIAIQRWREKHLEVENRIVPHSIIEKKLKGVQFKVDVIGHLSRLVALCEDRMARGLQVEERDFNGMPIPANDTVMQTYLDAIREYVKVAQDLGILKARPQAPLIDARTMNITPESLAALRDTVREIKRLENGRPGRIEAGNTPDDQEAGSVSSSEG